MIVLFIGDVISKIGRRVVREVLFDLKQEFSVDLTIANGENVTGFRGLDEKTYRELMESGVDVFTSGNHIWDNKNVYPLLKSVDNIVVPANFPSVCRDSNPVGKGSIVVDVAGEKVAIINLQGRVYLDDIDCPFKVVEDIVKDLSDDVKIRIVDFHAEATSEKRAMGHFLNGKVSLVLGTHTHVQTADEEILSEGTAYITDVGMTGPRDSVIGIKKDIIINKFLTGLPQRFEVSKLDPIISFLVCEFDSNGKAKSIRRFLRSIDL